MGSGWHEWPLMIFTVFGQCVAGGFIVLKWFTEFGHLNRGDMLTSEQHRCHNE
ncbi:dimethyl sulfoxide reductase anchor subunit, partial [Escherichia coli]|uniref:DmsC/YnfH family molybdoenzyme membrane anchor subunit n=1 Tax=Escherichia coli TaxID=562 RepID=UPI001556F8CB